MILRAINGVKGGTGEGEDCSLLVAGGRGLLDFKSKGGTAPGRSGEVIFLSFTYLLIFKGYGTS